MKIIMTNFVQCVKHQEGGRRKKTRRKKRTRKRRKSRRKTRRKSRRMRGKSKKRRRKTKKKRGRGKKGTKKNYTLKTNPFADELTQQEMDEYEKAHKEIMLAPKTRKMLDELCKEDSEECRNAIADLIPQNVKKMGKYTYKTIDGMQRLIFTPLDTTKNIAMAAERKLGAVVSTPVSAHAKYLKKKAVNTADIGKKYSKAAYKGVKTALKKIKKWDDETDKAQQRKADEKRYNEMYATKTPSYKELHEKIYTKK